MSTRTPTIQAWIDALRDGRPQTQQVLQDADGQCCLGVVCEVLRDRGELPKSVHYVVKDGNGRLWANHKLKLPFVPERGAEFAYVATAIPFDILIKQIGLDNEQVFVLTELNDDQGASFEEIATQLEEWFPVTPEYRRAVWVEALRSGAYSQGRGRLAMGQRFCCLGVACDALDKRGLLPEGTRWVAPVHGASGTIESKRVRSLSFLTKDMNDALGLGEDNQNKLIRMNDSQSATFGQIADAIEAL